MVHKTHRTKDLVRKHLGITKHGVIFDRDTKATAVPIGDIIKRLKWLALWLSRAGMILMVISFTGIVLIYIPLGFAEMRYAIINSQLGRGVRIMDKQLKNVEISIEIPVPTATGESKFRALEKPDWNPPDPAYSINIPKIMAVSKVITNVDANNPAVYRPALMEGVAEAAGLSHPGQLGTTYLFAHSVGNRIDFARYNAVFYLLDKLGTGDRVEVVYRNRLYKYRVTERLIVEPTDIEYLIPQYEEEKLILQTCYPPGTTWKRLVVTAHRLE